MEQRIFDENNGLWYERQDDYHRPCLTVLTDEEKSIDLWGRRHLQYIRREHKAHYLIKSSP